MEKYTVGELLRYMVKRWWVILAGILIFTFLLGVPKTIERPTVQESYTYSLSRLVRFDHHAMVDTGADSAPQYQNYNDIWFRNVFLADFVESISGKYEMDRFHPDWDTLGETDKIDWVKETIRTSSMANTPNYAMDLVLTTDEENRAYVDAHIDGMMDDFVAYATESTKLVSTDSASAEIDRSRFVQNTTEEIAVNPFKYYVVGAVLGFIMGVFAAGVWFLADKRVVSKSFFSKEYLVEKIDNGKRLSYNIFCYLMLQMKKANSRQAAMSSTMADHEMAQKVAGEFAQSGYRLLVINLTDREFHAPQGVDVLAAEQAAALRIPGREQQLNVWTDGYDYVLVVAQAPSADPASAGVMSGCACSVLVEKVGVSLQAQLKASIEQLQYADSERPVCIAWL